jgi:hypothetical protein
MTRLTAAALAALVTLAGPALAQTKTPPPSTPTMLTQSPVSMTSLLKNGWTAVSQYGVLYLDQRRKMDAV